MRSYPLRHLSIRVPWHDNGWDGTPVRSKSEVIIVTWDTKEGGISSQEIGQIIEEVMD